MLSTTVQIPACFYSLGAGLMLCLSKVHVLPSEELSSGWTLAIISQGHRYWECEFSAHNQKMSLCQAPLRKLSWLLDLISLGRQGSYPEAGRSIRVNGWRQQERVISIHLLWSPIEGRKRTPFPNAQTPFWCYFLCVFGEGKHSCTVMVFGGCGWDSWNYSIISLHKIICYPDMRSFEHPNRSPAIYLPRFCLFVSKLMQSGAFFSFWPCYSFPRTNNNWHFFHYLCHLPGEVSWGKRGLGW